MADKSLPVLGKERRTASGVTVTAKTYSQMSACVHCGLCLQACPTYVETMDEADSPRGRIHLMKAIADGRIGGEAEGGRLSDGVFEHLDRCLVCRACETACPSGVNYHEIIEAVRPQVAARVLGAGRRMRSGKLQWMIDSILTRPGRLAAATAPARLARKIGLGGVARRIAGLFGGQAAREAMDMLPASGEALTRTFYPAIGRQRGAVALLRGCVGSVLSGGVNPACVKVLTHNGVDVHLLAAGGEGCCGAMAAHANDPVTARELASQLVQLLEARGDAAETCYISPIAGCGAQLKALGHTLAGTPMEARAKAVAGRMRDVSEFLIQVGLEPPKKLLERVVTYHDPCHLVHAQRVTAAPRQILAAIPGLKVVPLVENDMCCGAAGTYNLSQPELAARLGRRKVANLLATGAGEIVTANIGCSLQIQRHLREAGHDLPVRHVVEVLAEAYG